MTAEDPNLSAEVALALARIVGPEVGMVAGQIAGHAVQSRGSRRAQRRILADLEEDLSRLKRACEMIEESGLKVKPLSAKHLFPTLAGLELEDDPGLQERWSALIANAATGDATHTSAFAEILKQIEPVEAQMLQDVYDGSLEMAPQFRSQVGISSAALCSIHKLDVESYTAHVDNLMRHRLVSAGDMAMLGRQEEYQAVRITSYGIRFVRACRAPGIIDPPPKIATQEQMDALLNSISERNVAEIVDGAIDGGGP